MTPDDNCTFWLDGWPTWLGGTGDEWLHCCIEHDYGGSDWLLSQCVAQEAGFGMALIMLIGVTIALPIRILLWRKKNVSRTDSDKTKGSPGNH